MTFSDIIYLRVCDVHFHKARHRVPPEQLRKRYAAKGAVGCMVLAATGNDFTGNETFALVHHCDLNSEGRGIPVADSQT